MLTHNIRTHASLYTHTHTNTRTDICSILSETAEIDSTINMNLFTVVQQTRKHLIESTLNPYDLMPNPTPRERILRGVGKTHNTTHADMKLLALCALDWREDRQSW